MALSITPTAYDNYDFFMIKLDSNPSIVAYWFGQTTDTSLQYSASDLAALGITSPGTHTFYYQDRFGATGSTDVTFVPEPAGIITAMVAIGCLAWAAMRRPAHGQGA